MSNIFFTSDTHYGHSNIASKNSSKWDKGYRDFNSTEEMNRVIVKNINKLVKYEDTLYHLGDWSFGGIDNIWNFRKQIVCKNIHLILGNHDSHIELDKTLPNCPNLLHAKHIFDSVDHYKEITIGKTNFILSHYAHRVWKGHHKEYIHLYGHSHDSLDKNNNTWGKSMDVGIDSAHRIFGEYRPFHLEEIEKIMYKREVYLPDHHHIETNI